MINYYVQYLTNLILELKAKGGDKKTGPINSTKTRQSNKNSKRS